MQPVELSRTQRSEAWRAEVAETCLAMRVAQLAEEPAQAGGNCYSLGRVGMAEFAGTPLEVLRTAKAVREAPSDQFKIYVQLAGDALVSQGSQELQLGPGDMALYDLARPYRIRMTSAWRVAFMTFPRNAVNFSVDELATFRNVRLSSGTPIGALVAGHLERSLAAAAYCDAAAKESLGSAALCLLDALLTAHQGHAPSQYASLRASVLAYVRHNLNDPTLCHASVAAAHHVSPRTLHKVFSTQSRTVTQTIVALRLEAVRRDLGSSVHAHRTIASIAARRCFTDAPHFSRIFKAAFGESPAACRARLSTESRARVAPVEPSPFGRREWLPDQASSLRSDR
jgi:AraC-like DNA-binding protein